MSLNGLFFSFHIIGSFPLMGSSLRGANERKEGILQWKESDHMSGVHDSDLICLFKDFLFFLLNYRCKITTIGSFFLHCCFCIFLLSFQ